MSHAPTLSGHCYCGAVRFEIDVPEAPRFAIYCHCDSCRRAHAAPLYQVVAMDDAGFRITAGAEHVKTYRKPGARIARSWCDACGTRVYNRFPEHRPNVVVVFPDLLEESVRSKPLPAPLRATRHAHAEECVLDFALLAELRPG